MASTNFDAGKFERLSTSVSAGRGDLTRSCSEEKLQCGLFPRLRELPLTLAVMVLAWTFGFAGLGGLQGPLGRKAVAAEKQPAPADDEESERQGEERRGEESEDHASSTEDTFRLNFFNATWPDVIRRVGKASDSQVVMQRAPRGRLTRLDRGRYSRQDAVRILNKELESKGFRLIEQGPYLVLLDLDMLRTRYERPVVPRETRSPESAADRAEVELPSARDTAHHGASHHDNPARDARGKQTPLVRPAGGINETESQTEVSRVRPMSGESDRGTSIGRKSARTSTRSSEMNAPRTHGPKAETGYRSPADGESSETTVKLRQRRALDVSRLIYRSLKDRSELIDAGPQGLPAFRVYESPGRSDVEQPPSDPTEAEFVIGIDTDQNRLVVEAAAEHRENAVRLIRAIDDAETDSGKMVQLIASPLDAEAVARRLRPAVGMLMAQRRGEGPPREQNNKAADKGDPVNSSNDTAQKKDTAEQADSDDGVNDRGNSRENGSAGDGRDGAEPNGESHQPSRDSSPPEAEAVINDSARQSGEAADASGTIGDAEPLLKIDGLRGSVTIRDVPGIGLVVTGNREDVEAVTSMIQELERVAGGRVPDIHLLLLESVNSVALAELLNEVYEELTRIRSVGSEQQPSASIIPVVRPNALLIVGSPGDIETINELAGRLDKPIDSSREFQVFHLEHAVPSQVVATLDSLTGETDQEGAGGLRPRVRAVADARTNSVIVEAAPQDLEEVAGLIRQIDRDSSGAVSRLQVFPLKNALADELAEVISAALQSVFQPVTSGAAGQGAGQADQQLLEAKSIVLELLTADGDQGKTVRSGLLADIRVTADPRGNSLLVTAPEQSMPLMAELIRHLDRPSSTVSEIKVFTLTNSDATAMADLLSTLFESGDESQLGIQLVGAEDASSSLVPMRFSVDVRTNSLIAVGGPESLRVVEAILLRLDQTDVRQRKSTVIRLRNSPVVEVAEAINAFLQSQRDLAEIDPELVSNIEVLEREIIVVPEAVNNSLLVSATPRYYDEILDLVQKLDEAPQQVMIQVLIVEVELENTDEFGVELGFQDSILFDRGLLNTDTFTTITETFSNPGTGVQTTTERIVNEERVPGFLFNNQQLGNNTRINPSSVGTQGLSNFSLGRINGDLGFGGLVLSASSESISMLIRALAAQRTVHILSRPQIRTLDNQLAQIQVGQQVPVISGATTNNFGGITPVIGTPQQIGIILEVTPRIRPDGTIVMETIANKSRLSGQGVPIITDPTTGVPVESPIFDLTEAQATVAVPDGQTIVLGGMITKSDETIERKVPWIGDIPFLGVPFRFDSTTTRRTELLIFMTPRIIDNDADSELIKQIETERIHFIEEDAEEIHGPLFGVPASASTHPEVLYPSSSSERSAPSASSGPSGRPDGSGPSPYSGAVTPPAVVTPPGAVTPGGSGSGPVLTPPAPATSPAPSHPTERAPSPPGDSGTSPAPVPGAESGVIRQRGTTAAGNHQKARRPGSRPPAGSASSSESALTSESAPMLLPVNDEWDVPTTVMPARSTDGRD